MKNKIKCQVSNLIKNNSKFLLSLAKTKSRKKQIKFVSLATSDELLSLVEICLNLLKNRIPLNKRQRNLLLGVANIIRKLSRSKSVKTARNLLIKSENKESSTSQFGRGIPTVAALVASLLLPHLSEIF